MLTILPSTIRARVRLYWQLMRAHQPVGVWLLFWPAAWAIALSAHGQWSIAHCNALLVAALGAFLMRSAGCVVNDVTDKDLDLHVARTAARPIAAGVVSVREGWWLAGGLTMLAGALVLPYGLGVVAWAVAALPLVVLYPRMKRISWWPQAFLGLTFNWGALLGWVMVNDTLAWPAVALYIGGIFWTLGYDTIYAYQDAADDAVIGIRSSARRIGAHPHKTLALFYAIAVVAWALAAWGAGLHGAGMAVALLGVVAHFAWQIKQLDIHNLPLCGVLFRSNVLVGWLLLAGMMAG